jgi:hypothetical protein
VARKSKSPTGGRFDTHGKKTSDLAQKEDSRTYRDGKRLGWHIQGREILLHIVKYETECPLLNTVPDKLFVMLPEYQWQAV